MSLKFVFGCLIPMVICNCVLALNPLDMNEQEAELEHIHHCLMGPPFINITCDIGHVIYVNESIVGFTFLFNDPLCPAIPDCFGPIGVPSQMCDGRRMCSMPREIIQTDLGCLPTNYIDIYYTCLRVTWSTEEPPSTVFVTDLQTTDGTTQEHEVSSEPTTSRPTTASTTRTSTLKTSPTTRSTAATTASETSKSTTSPTTRSTPTRPQSTAETTTSLPPSGNVALIAGVVVGVAVAVIIIVVVSVVCAKRQSKQPHEKDDVGMKFPNIILPPKKNSMGDHSMNGDIRNPLIDNMGNGNDIFILDVPTSPIGNGRIFKSRKESQSSVFDNITPEINAPKTENKIRKVSATSAVIIENGTVKRPYKPRRGSIASAKYPVFEIERRQSYETYDEWMRRDSHEV